LAGRISLLTLRDLTKVKITQAKKKERKEVIFCNKVLIPHYWKSFFASGKKLKCWVKPLAACFY
jgi:hypothetical protein